VKHAGCKTLVQSLLEFGNKTKKSHKLKKSEHEARQSYGIARLLDSWLAASKYTGRAWETNDDIIAQHPGCGRVG
jgi:hypothetical protein